MKEGDKEETVFNMVNSMLLRIHQSGHLAELESERLALVKEGLEVYRGIRGELKEGIPFWPLGLSHFSDTWVCLGMDCGEKIYLAVWRRELKDGESETIEIPVIRAAGQKKELQCIYPNYSDSPYQWDCENGIAKITLEKDYMARLYCLK